MRYVIYGAGAVGAVVGALLDRQSNDVVLIARGAHLEALREDGLRLRTPSEELRVEVPVVETPAQAELESGDVCVLAMKTQDTQPALEELARCASEDIAVVCCQNGVQNERLALRHFERVYGVYVYLPADHLAPGVITNYFDGPAGLLDLGLYPSGHDETARSIAADLSHAGFASRALDQVMPWKYTKLLSNLGNAIEALCGTRDHDLHTQAQKEALACYEAAGIDYVLSEIQSERLSVLPELSPVDGKTRKGGSSWQSLVRNTGTIETDYLNGEIVLLGRLYGVPTPVNAALARAAADMARRGLAPSSVSSQALWAKIEQA
jgi:2-dehydropantoate 2-reductase